MEKVHSIRPGGISGNVYLLETGNSFILLDTGLSTKRSFIEKKLSGFGCTPGKLACIVLTHGDFDHCGNAHYFSTKFKAPAGIHKNDAIIPETGDMFINRKKKNRLLSLIIKVFMGIEKFKADFYLDGPGCLEPYMPNLKIIHTPGHSPGSCCLVTPGGNCFCGDLFENIKKPRVNSLIDDINEMENSVKMILAQEIISIYPGHGNPFLKSDLIQHLPFHR